MTLLWIIRFSIGLWFSIVSDQKHIRTPIQSTPIDIIFDTDTNNEVDDQHALAYLLFNQETFDIKGITVNATYNGGAIDGHYEEAKRIMMLCNAFDSFPLINGANGNFETIATTLTGNFDGKSAVDFIISESQRSRKNKLVILAVGKLTNVALALKKAPEIATKIKVVWLGSNYPDPGEYNLENDIPAMNYVLDQTVPFEMVTVRYGKPSGTDAVRITEYNAKTRLKGLGPIASTPITGRHGGLFYTFGDYAQNLFNHIEYYGNPPARALFDMAAVAILKNPNWAQKSEIPAPYMREGEWVERSQNTRKIILWEYFNEQEILEDFFHSLKVFTPEDKKSN